VAKPLRCRLRLRNWEHRETPRPKSATRSVFAVTPTETEGMQPLVLAQLESPAQASVEGYPSCAVRHGVQQRSRFSVSASWSICVRPTPGQGLVHNARGVPDDAAGMIK
jgi:hypothetical protein